MAVTAMHTAATGMKAQSLGMDVIANNLANVNTTAFKRQQVSFEDMLYQNMRLAGKTAGEKFVPSGISVGLGTKVSATTRVFAQGSVEVTERPLDVAIRGLGFFKLTLPADVGGGSGYTRAGVFARDGEGNLVTASGYTVEPAITIPSDATDVSIRSDGLVLAKLAGATELTELGQIQLASFPNPEGLSAYGENIFLATEASGSETLANPTESGMGQLEQGAVENSNVDIVKELVGMIQTQRAFEVNSQVIQSANEAMQVVTNLIRF